ncbi:MAG: TasA family protein [Candidatus Taylorbacteria bacterium]|nr:TasA family protein [Candidatus Taylorbacteria bacterium]
MKRILLALSAVVFLGAAVAGGTGAFFGDVETSTGNTFAAGSLDLKVDSQCHYYQDNIDVGCTALTQGSTTPVAFGNWTETDLVPGVHKFLILMI